MIEMDGNRASRLRQRIMEQAEILGRLAQEGLGREPLMTGSLYRRRRRCGKQGCRCSRGALHRDLVLAVARNRRRRVIAVSRDEEGLVRGRIEGWRRMQAVRKGMLDAFGDLVRTFDELNRSRCEELSEPRPR